MKCFNKVCLIIMFMFVLNINVYAKSSDDGRKINPEWIKYTKLSEEEKKNYTAIPEKYIYEYIPNTKPSLDNSFSVNNDNFNTDYIPTTEELPSYFNMADIDGKRYINTINKNQSTLGLCWAFAAIGSFESNMLYNGVKGLDEMISKCNETNDENACSYKEDKKINDYYINNAIKCYNGKCPDIDDPASITLKSTKIDNATFSERHIDYISAKPKDSGFYPKPDGYITTPITEEYNYYNLDKDLAAGGYFSYVSEYYSYGIAPIRTKGEHWTKYTTDAEAKTLEEVFDSVKNQYQVTSYFDFPIMPTDEKEKEEWIQSLKTVIKKYGSVYVSTKAPQSSSSGSCYFYDKENNIDLINDTGICGLNGGHAMQIIGWDDDYEFEYCKIEDKKVFNNGNERIDYKGSISPDIGADTKENCETEKTIEYETYTSTIKGTWTSGKGAWILKNSWSSKTFPYLSYQSEHISVSGVREVSVKNFDNTYNDKNSEINYNLNNGSERIYSIKKADNKEYLTRFNVDVTKYNTTMNVYISNDGINYKHVKEQYIDLPGLYTFDVENFEVFGETIYIKIVSDSISIKRVNAFTINECTLNNSCTDEKELHSTVTKKYFEIELEPITIYTKTKNIASGTQLEFKILDKNTNNDISNKFEITPNYVIENANIATIQRKEEIPAGEYIIRTTTDEIIDDVEFMYVTETEVEIASNKQQPFFTSDSGIKFTPIFTSTTGVSNVVWSTDNEEVATIDQDGNITIKGNGVAKITITADTYLGEISASETIYIYDKVYSVEEYLNKVSDPDVAIYLMNDLDFKNIDFNEYDIATPFMGVINGNNHTIKNVTRIGTGNEKIGLFKTTTGAHILNLKLVDCYFEGMDSVGAIAGYAFKTNIDNVYNYSSIKGEYSIGGFVGEGERTNITQSYYRGDITLSTESIESYVGGFIGTSYSSRIYDSYNEGNITYTVPEDNYSVIGGFVGYNERTYVVRDYFTGKIDSSLQNNNTPIYMNGINGEFTIGTESSYVRNSYYIENENYTTELADSSRGIDDLKQMTNYTEWDFVNVWYMEDSKSTPRLKKFPIDNYEIGFNISNNTLKVNTSNDFNYKELPNSLNDTIVYSDNEEIFTIEDKKIVTNSNTGIGNVVFKIGEQELKYPITVIEPMISITNINTIPKVQYDNDKLYDKTKGFVEIYFSIKDLDINDVMIKILNKDNQDQDLDNELISTSEFNHSFKITIPENKAPGIYTIKIYTNEASDDASFEIYEYIEVEEINTSTETINIYKNETYKLADLNIEIIPNNSFTREYTLKIENEDIAKIENNMIIPNKVGNTKLKITSESITKDINIIIKDNYISFDSTIELVEKNNIKYLKRFEATNDLLSKDIVLEKINTNYDIEFSDDIIKTGTYLTINNIKYYIVIQGDVNGDGKLSIIDLSQVRRHLAVMDGHMKTGAFLEAIDMNYDNNSSILDLSQMRKKLAN